MTIQEKLDIIQNQFGLQIQEIEPTVYKVINTNKEVNIDKLQWALEECILLTSDEIRTEKLPTGIHTKIMYIYCIITCYDTQLAWKYDDIFTQKYKDVLFMDYKYNPQNYNHIDTLYSTEELAWQ